MLLSNIIEKHAPLQSASRSQRRFQKNPITKGLLVSIKTSKGYTYKKSFLNGNGIQKSFSKTSPQIN